MARKATSDAPRRRSQGYLTDAPKKPRGGSAGRSIAERVAAARKAADARRQMKRARQRNQT
jgi:hypothetical protein